MNVLDRARLEVAVQRYDWWLALRGAPGRRRRELRRELRANLADAAAGQGSRAAVSALGSTRTMAAEALPVDLTNPRWSAGAAAGAVAVAAVLLVELWAALGWLDGVVAAGPSRGAGPVAGSLTLFPGSSLEYARAGSGFSLAFEPGWLCLVAGLLGFLAVARPWRALRGRALPSGRTVVQG